MDTKKCNKCGKVKPLPEMTRRRDEEIGEFKYLSLCKSCKAEYQKKHKMEKREAPKPPKPSVWDLTCMPRGLSVADTVQLQNEAFPLLSNEYWKVGEAQSIYKQFGMKWSYL